MERQHRVYPPILERAREMRHTPTPAEATLWHALRNRRLSYKLRRQHPIDRFIVDFYCAEAKLCVEVDGDSHLEPAQQEYDAARTTYLEKLGYQVIRFTNHDVRRSIYTVLDEIVEVVESKLDPPSLGLVDDTSSTC